MTHHYSGPLVWVKDKAGNMFACPVDALRNINSLSEEEKAACVDDASRLDTPEGIPAPGKLKFSESKSLS